MPGVPPEQLARAARLYRTNGDAAVALGMTTSGFVRACKREGIETPYQRRKRLRPAVAISEEG